MTRKSFLGGAAMILIISSATGDVEFNHPTTDVYDGWRLGVQAWSFNRFSFFEAVDKTRELGLNWIQGYPGQRVAPHIDARMGPDLPENVRQEIREKLSASNVRMVAFGVVGIPADEAAARRMYAFARDMGVEVLVSEPAPDHYDLIDKLSKEYEIKMAVHNHPKPNRYWHPDNVLEAIEGRSEWLGVSADVGHWVRSGLNPVEKLKRIEGRIYDIHMKEVDVERGHDVVWGTGQARTRPILEELHRQGYQGLFAAEYEHSWDNNVPLIRKSAEFFNSVAAELNPSGWRNLFEGDLSNAVFAQGSWKYEDGVLELKGGGDIWTEERFGDFVLDFDFKVEERANSGVFIRTGNRKWLPWIEVQIADSHGKDVSPHICGAIFDIKAPKVNAMLPPGEWNRMTIRAEGPLVKVVLNNVPIIDIDLDDWTKAGRNPDGSSNKFNIAYRDLPREGFIGLQDHRDGTKVWYRNMRIREL